MFDLVKFLLRLTYYQSRLLGVLDIEIDLRTGRARRTRLALVQATIFHLVGGVYTVRLLQSRLWLLLWFFSTELCQYFNLIIVMVQGHIMYVTVLIRALNRHRLVNLINAYRRLARKRPQIVRLWRLGVIRKCFSVAFTQLMQVGVILCMVKMLSYPLIQSIVVLYLPSTFLDLVTFQFYFALINAHSHYKLLNQELREVLNEMVTLESLVNRSATLMIRCCSLADRLEAIAKEQCQLQALVDDLSSIFGPQSLCIAGNYYLRMVTLVFYIYDLFKLNVPTFHLGITVCKVLSHMQGMYLTSKMAYTVLDSHEEMVNMLRGCSTIALQLDERLEAVVSRAHLLALIL